MSSEAWTGLAVAGVMAVDLGHDAGQIPTLREAALLEAALGLVLFTDVMAVRRRDLRSGGFHRAGRSASDCRGASPQDGCPRWRTSGRTSRRPSYWGCSWGRNTSTEWNYWAGWSRSPWS